MTFTRRASSLGKPWAASPQASKSGGRCWGHRLEREQGCVLQQSLVAKVPRDTKSEISALAIERGTGSNGRKQSAFRSKVTM